MNLVQVPSDSGRALPAELRAGAGNGKRRLMAGQAVMHRGRMSGVGGVSGLGESCLDSATDAASAAACYTSGGASVNPSSGFDAASIASLLQSVASATVPLIANQPGVIYTRNADGSVTLYHQPTGSTANLPGVYGNQIGVPTVPGATLTSGQTQLALNATGLNTSTLMMVGVAGLLAVLLLSKGK